jgi:hypothetical protein
MMIVGTEKAELGTHRYMRERSSKYVEDHAREGTALKKGDLMFTIDPRPFKALVASSSLAQPTTKNTLETA